MSQLPYDLTFHAEADLDDIACYTLKKWGHNQSLRYAKLLGECFLDIADDNVFSRSFHKKYPQLKMTRCEHHYIFYFQQPDESPCIIAVLHERMNMLEKISERLA